MISVQSLRKLFSGRCAVDNLTFEVQRGTVLGFLGPNGAGKSTTMRMITGYLAPTSGAVCVDGLDVARHAVQVKAKIGYLPESAPGYGELTVEEFLRFSAKIRGVARRAVRPAVERAVELCFLQGVRHQTVGTLSKGFRHRTCLAQSLVHDPPVLIMDEPTDGLDPNQKHQIRTLIREMGRDKAIVFSTHILEEVEAACDRAILIDHGRLVADGTPEQLKARAPGAGDWWVRLAGVEPGAACKALGQIAGVAEVRPESGDAGEPCFRLRPGPGADPKALPRAVGETASANGWSVAGLRRIEGRLDAFFREVTVGDLKPAPGGRGAA